MEQKFSLLVNLMWKDCIQNLNAFLSEQDVARFSNNDYYYLTVIRELNKPNFSQLAERLAVTKPAISGIVRKLSDMGLIIKEQSKEDKRVYYVRLSDKGYEILNGDQELYHWVTDTIKNITKDAHELEIVENVINELVSRLEER